MELIRYVQTSRYAESDRLLPTAYAEFGGLQGEELQCCPQLGLSANCAMSAAPRAGTDGAVGTLAAPPRRLPGFRPPRHCPARSERPGPAGRCLRPWVVPRWTSMRWPKPTSTAPGTSLIPPGWHREESGCGSRPGGTPRTPHSCPPWAGACPCRTWTSPRLLMNCRWRTRRSSSPSARRRRQPDRPPRRPRSAHRVPAPALSARPPRARSFSVSRSSSCCSAAERAGPTSAAMSCRPILSAGPRPASVSRMGESAAIVGGRRPFEEPTLFEPLHQPAQAGVGSAGRCRSARLGAATRRGTARG